MRYYLFLLLAFICSSCSPYAPIDDGEHREIPPKFGNWFINDCTLFTKVGSIKFISDGKISSDKLYIKLVGEKEFVNHLN